MEEKLLLVRRSIAEAERLTSSSGDMEVPSNRTGSLMVGSDELVEVDENAAGVQIGFLVPTADPTTGEPVYDPRVVSGKGTLRRRAYAAARVYGT